MQIYFYNTLSKRKEKFVPISKKCIKMYVCGPTVYNYAHIGNARPAVTFDLLYRFLKHMYKQVNYVRNITDIDDKINQAAIKENTSIEELTKRYAQAYHEDMQSLNVLPPSFEPKATDYISTIIEMIEGLIKEKYAYESKGHVLFDVNSYHSYGQLRQHKPDLETSRERIESAIYKKNPQDFVLWKPAHKDDLLDWESPWSRGRPGWHIECSAMVQKCLGLTIDIHGGGQDLIFPHHENEIAQGSCANQQKLYCRYWLHNAFVKINGNDKMAKSAGDIILVHDLIKNIPGEIVRLALLSTHYRSPIEWNEKILEQSLSTLNYLYQSCLDTQEIYAFEEYSSVQEQEPSQAFLNALADDLNVAVALAEMHNIARKINKTKSENPQECKALKKQLLSCAAILGILQLHPELWFKQDRYIQYRSASQELTQTEIENYIFKRNEARATKNYKEADEIRNFLSKNHIELEDVSDSKTIWKRA